MDSATLNKALDRLRASSLDASKGTAYTCGPPWFRNSSGVLLGSPDPHAGQMIADTDTSLLDSDNHAEIDDDCNAIFLAEAWNFARMLLGSPALLDALRSTGTGRSEAEAMREAAKIVCLDLADAYRETSEHHIKNRRVEQATEAMAWTKGAMECAHAIRAIPAQAAGGGDA